jgi:hypothetical protein
VGRGDGAGFAVACGGAVVTVGATVEDSVGGKDVGIAVGSGSVAVGGRVCVGDGGTGVAGKEVGEAVGNAARLKVGGSVGVGVNVLVGKARTIRVRTGVIVGAGLAGVHWAPNSPSTLSKNGQR